MVIADGIDDEAMRQGCRVHSFAIAQSQFRISPAQIGIEGGVAGPGEAAFFVEGTVDQKEPTGDEPLSSAFDQPKRR